MKETMGFTAEVKDVLHLVIHSLYSNKEIFLRELLSNASDALDKFKFLSFSDANLAKSGVNLGIKISIDKEKNTLTISDNGIGMSKDELISHLGTIAKSGTKEFIKNLGQDKAKDTQLIGQFGVGFYAAYLVADTVTVLSRKAGTDTAAIWESDGSGEFTIEAASKADHGTDITLHLKADEKEFLESWRLRSIIHKYSEHLPFPIEMLKEAPPAEEGKEAEVVTEWETVNRATALWRSAKSELKDADYTDFYKQIAHDFDDPLLWSHNRVEGKQEYISLLYVPKHAPFDMWNREKPHGLKLYVQRVFIMDDAEQFLPNYLRFVKGVVDSNDLPLNISREILQSNSHIEKMRGALTKRVLDMLEKLSTDDKAKYQTFWDNFGAVLKEGPIEDHVNKELIGKLLRFASTHQEGSTQNISLDDYISRMKPGQEKIFYVTAETYSAARFSPHLEIFKKKGIEVLLLSDRVDEWLVNHLTDYQGKHLQSIAKGDLDLGDLADKTEIEEQKQQETEFESVLKRIKTALGEKVKEVKVTHRLTDSPACVVSDHYDMSGHLQRLLKASGQAIPSNKPTLEINPKHMLVLKLRDIADEDKFKDWSEILLNQAILAEGGHLEEPGIFVQKLNRLLVEMGG